MVCILCSGWIEVSRWVQRPARNNCTRRVLRGTRDKGRRGVDRVPWGWHHGVVWQITEFASQVGGAVAGDEEFVASEAAWDPRFHC